MGPQASAQKSLYRILCKVYGLRVSEGRSSDPIKRNYVSVSAETEIRRFVLWSSPEGGGDEKRSDWLVWRPPGGVSATAARILSTRPMTLTPWIPKALLSLSFSQPLLFNIWINCAELVIYGWCYMIHRAGRDGEILREEARATEPPLACNFLSSPFLISFN